MKRLGVCLGIALLLMGFASAEVSFTGTVVAGETLPILASYGGQITDIQAEAGQMVAEGQILGEVGTTRNYAPVEGTVTGLNLAEGDKTEDITERYGASLYIEPTNRYTIKATSAKAYNSSENQYVHLGERVYLKCVKNGVHRGTGMISALTEKGYNIEVTGGEFSMQETVEVFRSGDYAKESSLGRGTVGRTSPVAVKGTGSALKIYVQNGDFVERGELLFETVDGTLDGLYAPSGKIISPGNGIVSSIGKTRGETVTKNEVLMKIIPTDSLRVEFLVQEADLFLIREGQKVEMTLYWDTDSGRTYRGEITRISHMQEATKEGSTVTTDRKYFKAYASIQADAQMRAGMTVLVNVAEEKEEPAGKTEEQSASSETEKPEETAPAPEDAEQTENSAAPEEQQAEVVAITVEEEQPAEEIPTTVEEEPAVSAETAGKEEKPEDIQTIVEEEPAVPAETAGKEEEPAEEIPTTVEGEPAEPAETAGKEEKPAEAEQPTEEAGIPAYTGDRTLLQTENGSLLEYVERMMVVGTKVYLYVSGSSPAFHVYDTRTGNTDIYDMTELQEKLTRNGEEVLRTEDGAIYTENVAAWFPWKGEIYAVVCRNISMENGADIDGGYVRKLILAEGNAGFQETEIPQLEWEEMVERNGASRYNRWINSTVCSGNSLVFGVYGDNGDLELHIFDLETGKEVKAEFDNLEDVGRGPEGRMLIGRRERRGEEPLIVEMYDLATGESQELARFEDGYNVRGIAYQPGNSTLYYVTNGEIFAAKDGKTENAESVNDCGLTPSGLFTEITEDGYLAVYRYDGAMVLGTDPSRRNAVTIRIHPYTWYSGDNATYYAFANAWGDVNAVREDGGDESTLLQSMMNQDNRVDIYTIDASSSVYDAIYSRGFMGSLESSEKLKTAISQMYPFLRDACQKNGTLVAIPINMNGASFGYHVEAWSKLGLTQEDLPRTWEQLLDLLERLPEKLEGTEYRPFEVWMTKQNFRGTLMSTIVQQYAAARPEDGFNTPVLRGLLERAYKLDLDALGLYDEEEMEDVYERYEEMGGGKTALLISDMEVPMNTYRQDYQAMILSFAEGEETMLPASLSVAFLNPYSTHPKEAIAYLETMLENLDANILYSFYPDRNEPMRYPDHEELKKNMVQWNEQAKAQLAEAEDEETRESLEKNIESLEKELAEFDETYWMISPGSITNYRERAKYIQTKGYDFWTMLYSGENGETFSTLWSGFLEGQRTAQEVLSFMDQKVQMMRTEGN